MDDNLEWLIQGLNSGDPEAARVFCRTYGQSLERLADKRIQPALRRRFGPESVCQSVCRSFLRRAGAGEYQLSDSEELWRLLCAITLTKVREKARFHRRQKRSVDREQGIDADREVEGKNNAFEPVQQDPSPAQAAEFKEQFEQLLCQFDEEEQQIIELKLQEHTNDEIAARMGCSERTVRRLVQRLKARLQSSPLGQ
jgi:RNA polymerase sigma-70 factor (ECF subfamily)